MKRFAVTGLGILAASCVVGIGIAAPSQAAPSSAARSEIVATEVTLGDTPEVLVTARGLAKGWPLTVDWGDGSISQVTTTCSVARAKKAPARCGAELTHDFPAPGTYPVAATYRDQTLVTGSITVSPSATAVDPEQPQPEVPDSWRQEMLELVNAERAKAGVAPVRLCPALGSAAQRFAQYQADADFYSHVGPDGSTMQSRIEAAGYSGWRSIAENIYKSPTSVKAAMDGWIASPGHYKNLVNPAYTDIGFGYAKNPDTRMGTYWVQNFGRGGRC